MFFDGFGADLQNDVAQFELGVAEDLALGLADEQPGHLQDFVIR
jgi:hypothetical protein